MFDTTPFICKAPVSVRHRMSRLQGTETLARCQTQKSFHKFNQINQFIKPYFSTVSNDGRCEEEVRRRIQAGWMSWRKVSGVLCDRKLSAKVKGKIYKSVVRPAMLYGMETVAVTERQMGKMEIAELKMVRWALGVTRKDKIRNEYVRGTAKIAKLGEKLRNVRLRWYGHVKRREEDYVGKRMMEMAVPGRRKRGRPRRRWMDLVREDMERVGAREGDEVDRVKWRLLSRCGDPE